MEASGKGLNRVPDSAFGGQSWQELQNFLLQFLARLEFYHGAGGDRHITDRVVGIPADLWFGDADFEGAEVA